jgi:hypothetical protein
MRETDLYQPVKALFEERGYEVKSEILDCDVVAIKDDEPPVIIELKLAFNLPLVFQGIRRQAISDQVFLAVAKGPSKGWRKSYKDVVKLCRLLGLGLIAVKFHKTKAPNVEIHLEPEPYKPRLNHKRKSGILKEFEARAGDPNLGGSAGKPLVTAYRQDALRCSVYLSQNGPTKASLVAKTTAVKRAAAIMNKNHYDWFSKVDRGIYQLNETGFTALEQFQTEIAAMNLPDFTE